MDRVNAKKIGWGISIILIMLLVFLYYFLNPERDSLFPSCPLLYLTGYECPGCGSQRAFHALLHFDIVQAIRYNLLLVLALPYLGLYLYIELLGGSKYYPKLKGFLFEKKVLLALGLIVVLYGILRNII